MRREELDKSTFVQRHLDHTGSRVGLPSDVFGSGSDQLAGVGQLRSRSVNDIVISSSVEVVVMTNLLIRGLSDSTVERIDAEASALGLSRNEFLRRKLEGDSPRSDETTTDENWRRAGEIFADLADPDVMADAWR